MPVAIRCPALCAAASPAPTSVFLPFGLVEGWSLAATQSWVAAGDTAYHWGHWVPPGSRSVPGAALSSPSAPEPCLSSAVDAGCATSQQSVVVVVVDPSGDGGTWGQRAANGQSFPWGSEPVLKRVLKTGERVPVLVSSFREGSQRQVKLRGRGVEERCWPCEGTGRLLEPGGAGGKLPKRQESLENP